MSDVGTKAAVGVLGGAGIGGTCYYGYQSLKPTNLKEQLSWDYYVPLKADGEDNDEDWKLLLKGHLAVTDDGEKKKLNGLRLSDSDSEAEAYDDKYVQTIKNKCKGLYETEVPEEGVDWNDRDDTNGFAYKYYQAVDWCTEESDILKSERDKKAKEDAEKKKQEDALKSIPVPPAKTPAKAKTKEQ